MTNNSESNTLADLTHQYHDKYRSAGIALCISLATVASTEGLWFYSFFSKVASKCDMTEILIYDIAVISAILLFGFSFVLQFLNYDGVKHMANSFLNAYKISASKDKALEENKEEVATPRCESLEKFKESEWVSARNYFNKADTIITWLKVLAIVNFSAALCYIVKYRPGLSTPSVP